MAYVQRVMQRIIELEGSADSVDERVRLELELEAFANLHASVVDDIAISIRVLGNRRLSEIGLIILGRVKSDRAIEFLVQVAGGNEPMWRDSTPEPSEGLQTDRRGGSLSRVAIDALFQGSGRVGPVWPHSSMAQFVRAMPCTLCDPRVLGEIVGLMDDESVPEDARHEILVFMDRNLPDPEEGGVGDYPRNEVMEAAENQALEKVLRIAERAQSGPLRDRAQIALGYVQRHDVRVRLLEIALATEGAARATSLGQIAHAAQEPLVARALHLELERNADGQVRGEILGSLPNSVLSPDGEFRSTILNAIARDSDFSVRSKAATRVLQTGDESLILQALDHIQGASAESYPSWFRRSLVEQLQSLPQRIRTSDRLRVTIDRMTREFGR